MNDLKSIELLKSTGFDSAGPGPEEPGQAASEPEFHETARPGLPFESPPDTRLTDVDNTQAGDEADETLRQLSAFFFNAPASSGSDNQVPVDLPRPALLYQYRDLPRIRHDYPLCLNENNLEKGVLSLSVVIDELISGLGFEGDSGQLMRQQLYQMEAEIRVLSDADDGAGLPALWDRAAKKLLSSAKLSSEKKNLLQENLATARRILDIDYETITCNSDAPVRLLSTLAALHWQRRCTSWHEQLELLIQQLQDILSVDFDHSATARSSQHLREASSTEDIDFDAMASILATDHLAGPLEGTRTERIQRTLETLLRIGPLFKSVSSGSEEDKTQPFSIRSIFYDCQAAIDAYQARMQIMLEFFKAAAIAELEVENRYRDAQHDEFFSNFDISQLSADELALCPPVLLVLSNDSLSQQGMVELLDILAAGVPIKILFLIDELCKHKSPAGQTSLVIDWPTRLANMVMALHQAYVLQSPLSRLAMLHEGMLDGLGYDGPALFSVYTGNDKKRERLPAYLDTASATECRLFPIFCFNPGKGQTQAECMDVSANSQCDRLWPLEALHYRTADDAEASIDLVFTPADFLLCDQDLVSQFRFLSNDQWHLNMLPLHDYLALDTQAAQSCIPYLLTVDNEGRLGRVIMTRAIVDLVGRCSSGWRELQELGGINNSFALNLLAEEKDHLAADMQAQVEAIENKYGTRLDQDIGRLTGEIVQRIAAQLVLDGDTGTIMPAQTPATTAPDAKAPPATTLPDSAAEEVAGPEEEEEDDIGVLDDPYIETPRCTTCDDCTNLNGQLFAYDDNKQAYIKDASAGPYKDMVRAAELCPVKIIHPGKPKNPQEAGLEELQKRAAPFL